MEVKTVLIIGGGLGGLALAQYLKGTGINAIVCERDVGPTGRSQGYLIGLNEDGTRIVSSLQISHMDEFLLHNDSSGFVMANARLKILMQVRGNPKKRDSALVNRWELRQLLTTDLQIQWNKKFSHYEEFSDHVIAHFEDGTSIKADVLIGADGAKSKVRQQRCPDMKYEYQGIINVAGFLPAPPPSVIPTINRVGHKTLLRVVSNSGFTMLVLPFRDSQNVDSWLWSFSHYCPLEENPYDCGTAEMLQRVKNRATAENFHPDVMELVEHTPIENVLPVGRLHAMTPPAKNPFGKTTRVTLLGDSAHAMTTHRGLGANTAFLDAVDLAKALQNPNWQQALAEYEDKMIVRGFKAAKDSLESTKGIHASGWGAITRDWIVWTIGWIFWAKDLVGL